MTCHFCGQPSTSVHEPGTQCLNCDKWFCKNCVDKDSHECFNTLLDTDQASVTPELRVGVTERKALFGRLASTPFWDLVVIALVLVGRSRWGRVW